MLKPEEVFEKEQAMMRKKEEKRKAEKKDDYRGHRRKTSRKALPKKKRRRGSRKKRILTAVLAALPATVAVVLIVFTAAYLSGRAKILSAVQRGVPDAGLLTDQEAAEELRLKAGLETVQWQEDWVAIDGKVYSYDSNRINLLVLGVDKKGKMDREPDYEKWLSGQTDAIFVVSIDPTDKSVSVIGVPRNSMTNVDVYDSEEHISRTIFDQICLQYPYAGGAGHGLEKTKEAVSKLLYNLPIHGAVAVGYEAMNRINDMAGGVDVVALESLDTPFGSYEKGESLHLEGKYVLAYVKSRDVSVIGSPTMRLERQKQYLTALAGKMKDKVKENPMIVKEMYDAVSGYINTDIGIDEMVYLAAQAAGYRFSGEDIHLLEGDDKAVPIVKDGKETGDFYDDLYLDEGNLKETMIEVFYKEVELGG